MSIKNKIALVYLGLAGWTFCAAIMGLGPMFFSIQITLIIHLILGPAGFGILCVIYYNRFQNPKPLTLAILWTLIVILMDAVLIAPFILNNYAMFKSVIGTWLPFSFIFIVTYLTGIWQNNKKISKE